jgi:hypothetical protein
VEGATTADGLLHPVVDGTHRYPDQHLPGQDRASLRMEYAGQVAGRRTCPVGIAPPLKQRRRLFLLVAFLHGQNMYCGFSLVMKENYVCVLQTEEVRSGNAHPNHRKVVKQVISEKEHYAHQRAFATVQILLIFK